MADIELVIKIDEKDYKKVLDLNNHDIEWNIAHTCYEAVLDGKPLPKGHGRLIDENDVLRYCALYQVPTIIEADKEGESE